MSTNAEAGGFRVVVGRIGRAQGLRGEVRVEVRTDSPDVRFAPGAVVYADDGRVLTVAAARWQNDRRLVVRFDGVTNRDDAEVLRGRWLEVVVDAAERTDDDDEFFDWQLVGMSVRRRADGQLLGAVREVLHLPGHDLLVVTPAAPDAAVPPPDATDAPDAPGPSLVGTSGGPEQAAGGDEVLVPFVRAMVVDVDLDAGVIVVDPPGGLFDPVPEPSA